MFRPKCPQVDVDVRHLLRIPEDYIIEEEAEDEFECLNLDVTVPANTDSGQRLPVFIWIYGKDEKEEKETLSVFLSYMLINVHRWLTGSYFLFRCVRNMRLDLSC